MPGIGYAGSPCVHRSRAATGSRRRDLSDTVLGRMSGDDVLRPVALVVDDEESVRESFRLVLDQDYDVLDVPDGARALDIGRAHHVDIVLLDIRLPEMDGIEVLERIKAIDDSVEVILVTAVKTVRTAVAAMKLGAFDYLTKPFEDEELLSLVRRAVEKRSLEREVTFLRGELARGGTLFLDEIGLLRAEVQAKLLRVLQEREIERVGGTRSIKIDVRIVAATNVDLKRAVAAGAFREDLYYRLNVVPVAVPPLRARIEDLPRLVDHFVRRYNHEFNKRIHGLTPEALALLAAYAWPGNVRELQNIVERTMVLVDGPLIGPADLPLDVTLAPGRPGPGQTPEPLRMDLNQASDRFERIIVQRVLEEVGGNVSEAARVLGLHRNSLKMKLSRWKLAGGESEEPGAQ